MKKLRGFTLLEVMVAVSVTLVLVILMLRIFSDGSTAWLRNDEKLDTFREARAALQMISQDFGRLSPVPRPDLSSTTTPAPGPTPSTTPEPVAIRAFAQFPMLTLRAHYETQDEDRNNHEVYGLVPTRNSGKGRLCAVGYYCLWDQDRHAFVLHRQCMESKTTYDNLKTVLHPVEPLNKNAAFNLLFARIRGTDLKTPPQFTDEPLATYIWDFRVTLPKIVTYDADGVETGSTDQGFGFPTDTFARELPAWMEVRFKALGSNAARKIEQFQPSPEMWSDPASEIYQKYILPGEQEFVTRIRLCR